MVCRQRSSGNRPAEPPGSPENTAPCFVVIGSSTHDGKDCRVGHRRIAAGDQRTGKASADFHRPRVSRVRGNGAPRSGGERHCFTGWSRGWCSSQAFRHFPASSKRKLRAYVHRGDPVISFASPASPVYAAIWTLNLDLAGLRLENRVNRQIRIRRRILV
jgi:hypothetical protein